MEARVFRCARQPELYLYLRADVPPEALPEALLRRTGQLTEVLRLRLDRPLARVDVAEVRQALASTGYFVQLPPDGAVRGHLRTGE
jgi:uncharacterized protein YcgL (UPF0745 family)